MNLSSHFAAVGLGVPLGFLRMLPLFFAKRVPVLTCVLGICCLIELALLHLSEILSLQRLHYNVTGSQNNICTLIGKVRLK